MEKKRRRKKYFIEPEFQRRYIAIIVLVSFILSSIMISFVLLVFTNKTMLAKMLEMFDVEVPYQLFFPSLIVAAAIGLIIVGILALFISHRIAGPLYRLKREIREIGEGDFSKVITLRKNDEFQDLAEVLNDALEKTRQRLASLEEVKKSLEEIERKCSRGKMKSKVKEVRSTVEEICSNFKM